MFAQAVQGILDEMFMDMFPHSMVSTLSGFECPEIWLEMLHEMSGQTFPPRLNECPHWWK